MTTGPVRDMLRKHPQPEARNLLRFVRSRFGFVISFMHMSNLIALRTVSALAPERTGCAVNIGDRPKRGNRRLPEQISLKM